MRTDVPVVLACMLVLAPAVHAQRALATRIVVDKSDHRLEVFEGDRVVASYPVALGLAPGAKVREGDRRTPEGRYVIDARKADSAYFLALHVSYPNAADRARARAQGVAPGGAIMIHGQPDDPAMRRRVAAWPWRDWTDGCIALSDADMRALWDRVRVPTPIEIRP